MIVLAGNGQRGSEQYLEGLAALCPGAACLLWRGHQHHRPAAVAALLRPWRQRRAWLWPAPSSRPVRWADGPRHGEYCDLLTPSPIGTLCDAHFVPRGGAMYMARGVRESGWPRARLKIYNMRNKIRA